MADLVSEIVRQDYRRLRESSGRIEESAWALIELTGEDRKDWLQGQATGDLRGLEEGGRRSFCLCEPTGQQLAVIDAWALPDRILMTTAKERTEAVLVRVERMTIMEDVLAAEVEREMVSIQGPTASRELAELLALPDLDAGITTFEGVEAWILRSDRTGGGGWDVWLPKGTTLAERFPLVHAEAYEAARIVAGIPKWNADMGTRTLPPELGTAFERRHVSYDKGCYTGQEILMRMHTRGHTNKTWMGLTSTVPMTIGSTVLYQGKEVGTVTSAALSPEFGPIAAATLRTEAAQPGERVLIDGAEAEVVAMPILK